MIISLLVATLVAWWNWGRRMPRNQLIAAALAIGGLLLLARRELWLGVPLLLPAIWLLFRAQLRAGPRAGRVPPPVAMDADEARRVLGLAADADADSIRAAHRRLVTRVHPDQGGSAELASRVNAARDILLAEQGKRYPR